MKDNYIDAKFINLINSILIRYEFENQLLILIINNINNNVIMFNNLISYLLYNSYNNIFNIKDYKSKSL